MKKRRLRITLYRNLFLAFFCLLILFLQSTARATGAGGTDEGGNIRDIVQLPQDPFSYLPRDAEKRLISNEAQFRYLKEFRTLYFSPWERNRIWKGKSTQNWIYGFFSSDRGYGENLKPLPRNWLAELKDRANLKKLGSLNKKAITVRESNLRLLPTAEPFYKNPGLPGEGYPFDYVQNSGIHAGEPIFVSHMSKDGQWAWCETSYAAGWIKKEDMAFVSGKFMDEWSSLPMGVVTTDNFTVQKKGEHLGFTANTGALFPMAERNTATAAILIPVRSPDGTAKTERVSAAAAHLKAHPLPLNGLNAAMICASVMGTPYGWAGTLGSRDCSSTLRDIFIPFGIWLPRNSSEQARSGIRTNLRGLSGEKKIKAILKKAKPFTTLIYRDGHITLYIGSHKNSPVVLHNMWGIKTLEGGKEGRKVVGKAVITSLEPGKELENLHPDEGLMLDLVTGMTHIGG